MSYEIKLSPDVVAYLKQKNKTSLTLDIIVSGGGCCPTFETSQITYKKPQNDQLYLCEKSEGITVYVARLARVQTHVLQFELVTQVIGKRIEAVGLALKTH